MESMAQWLVARCTFMVNYRCRVQSPQVSFIFSLYFHSQNANIRVVTYKFLPQKYNSFLEVIFYFIDVSIYRNKAYLYNLSLCQPSTQPAAHVLVGLFGFLPKQFTKPQSRHLFVQSLTSFFPAQISIAHFLQVLAL